MIVADTNLIIAMVTPGPRRDEADDVFLRDPVWHAALHWRSEVTSALAKMARGKVVSPDQARTALADALDLIAGRVHALPPADVLDAALASGCSGYDSEFVVLAQRLGCRLVTSDKQVLAAFPGLAVTPGDFLRLRPGA